MDIKNKEIKEFCDKEAMVFSAKVTKLFVTPKERTIWLLIQPRFQEIFMIMTHELGIDKSREIINYYFETEQRIKELTDKIILEKK